MQIKNGKNETNSTFVIEIDEALMVSIFDKII